MVATISQESTTKFQMVWQPPYLPLHELEQLHI